MNRLTFRTATPQDLPRIMALEAAGFAPGNREREDVYARRIEIFPEGSLLAELDGENVGCLFAEIWSLPEIPDAARFALGHDIGNSHAPASGNALYVASMTVAPAFRGRGLGTPLLAGALARLAAEFPRLEHAILLVNATWSRARALYAAEGFAEVARFAGFFAPAPGQFEDGIVMRRAIRTG